MKTKKLHFLLLIGLLCYGCNGKSFKEYNSINDLQQGTIGVLMGSSQDTYITTAFPKAKVLRIDMSTNLAVALNAGTCDVAVFDATEASALLKSYPAFGVLEKKLTETPMGVGFYNNSTLLNAFDTFLAKIKSDGTYNQIMERWINSANVQSVEMPNITLPQTGEPLQVGTSGTSTPYTFIKNGKNVGFDIEIITRFAAEIGRPIKFNILNFSGLIPALQTGKLDVIINCIMITPERAKKVNFSKPYANNVAQVLALKKNISNKNAGFKSREDVKDKRIAVLMGTIHDEYVTANFPNSQVIRSETYPDMLMALTMNKCEALVLNKVTYTSMHKSNAQIVLLDSTLYVDNVGMGFSYNQNDLKEQFNTFLKNIRKSKLYDEIRDRWIAKGEDAQMPNIKQVTTGDPIRIGVTGANIPFAFVRNGQYVGFDIELLMRFAETINRPVEFLIINFGGLISALLSEKVDIISAALVITPDRVKNVNFSDSYFQNIGVMAVLKENLAITGNNTTTEHVKKQGLITNLANAFYNNIIAEKRYMLILNGLGVTLIISIFAVILGTILGAGICFFRMSRKKLLNLIGKVYINLMRGIPILVLLMIMYYVVFAAWDINATVVAIIAFAMNFAAYVSEMFRTSIEGVDCGQSEAGIALGFTKTQTFRFIVMPQAIKSVLPVYKGELISLIKMTSVVGYIAVNDLTKASDIIRSRTFDAFFPLIMVAILYFLLAWLFASALDYYSNAKFARK
ncbi:MAG: ABC transporter permease subunit [Bacteroidales bacterium]